MELIEGVVDVPLWGILLAAASVLLYMWVSDIVSVSDICSQKHGEFLSLVILYAFNINNQLANLVELACLPSTVIIAYHDSIQLTLDDGAHNILCCLIYVESCNFMQQSH